MQYALLASIDQVQTILQHVKIVPKDSIKGKINKLHVYHAFLASTTTNQHNLAASCVPKIQFRRTKIEPRFANRAKKEARHLREAPSAASVHQEHFLKLGKTSARLAVLASTVK